MKTTLFWLFAALPAWAAAQSFQALPENSDTLDQLNSLHACSYHQLLPKQTMRHLSPDKLGPVIGVSVDRMEGKVFKLGKYFRPKDKVVFYADDEAFNVAASTNKSGLERACRFGRAAHAIPTQLERHPRERRRHGVRALPSDFAATRQNHPSAKADTHVLNVTKASLGLL